MKRVGQKFIPAAAMRACLLALAASFAGSAALAQAQNPAAGRRFQGREDEIVKNVRMDQKINAQVPLDLVFKNENGHAAPLREHLGSKPAMLMLIQYRCAMLCNEQMNILVDSLREMKFTPGAQFNLFIISIDPREDAQMAWEKKQAYLPRVPHPGVEKGWHYLTTNDDATIKQLAAVVGYHYVYDKEKDEYAHPDGVIVTTPQGRVARYFLGLDYPPRDMQFALMEAGNNRIGSLVERIALLCYHYDPTTGRYGLAVIRLVQWGAIATMLALACGMLMMRRRDRSAQSRVQPRVLQDG